MPIPIFEVQTLMLEMAAVWRLIVHSCTSEQAEAVVQDVYMRAFQTVDRVPDVFRGRPRLWLFRIACDVLQKRPSTSSEPPPARPVLDTPIHEMALDDSLQAAVCGMPMADRMVFLLSVVEQLRYEDIAVVLDVPIPTVIARLDEAHRFLRSPAGPPSSLGTGET